jgi:hypothetical protein
MGAIFDRAKSQWAEMHLEWGMYVEYQYNRALEECGGVLVNRLGRDKGIDGYSLFTGTWVRAKKYASEELLAYWAHNRRLTLAEFEEQWLSGQIEDEGQYGY